MEKGSEGWLGKFEEFYKLILHIHRIANMEVMIGYADVHGDLLPINNDDNFCKAVSTAHPLLRIFIQRQGRLSEKFLSFSSVYDKAGLKVTESGDAQWPHFFSTIRIPKIFS